MPAPQSANFRSVCQAADEAEAVRRDWIERRSDDRDARDRVFAIVGRLRDLKVERDDADRSDVLNAIKCVRLVCEAISTASYARGTLRAALEDTITAAAEAARIAVER